MTVLVLGLASAAYMAGVSWLVSLVVYPAFALVGAGEWAAYHRAHRLRITPVVLPGMVIELVTSGWLVVAPPGGLDVDATLAWVGLVLAAGTWALTGLVAVPDHDRLERSRDLAVAARLTRRHHARTLLWSAHAVVAALLVAGAL